MHTPTTRFAGFTGISIVLALGAAHAATLGRFLFSWDSANFALALDHIDLSLHQPHPPGYFGYVGVAKALSAVLHDHNTALEITTLLFFAGGLCMTLLWSRLEARRDRTPGVAPPVMVAGALLASSPLIWLYSSVAEIYVPEMTATTGVLLALRAFHVEVLPIGGIWCAWYCALLIKPSAGILLIPLIVVVLAKRGVLLDRRVLLGGAATVLLATATYVAFAGINALSLTLMQLRAASGPAGRFGAFGLRSFNRHTRDAGMALVMGLGPGGILLVFIAMFAAPGLRLRTWLAPWSFVFCAMLVLFIAKPGYVLPLLPACFISVESRLWFLRRAVVVPAVALAVVLNVSMFVLGRPFSTSSTGGSLKYASKTITQKILTELNAVTFATKLTIDREDYELAGLLSIAATCNVGAGIVETGTGDISWRQAMYYLPDKWVIEDPAMTGQPVRVAKAFKTVSVPQAGLTLSDSCGLIDARNTPQVWGIGQSVLYAAGPMRLVIMPEVIMPGQVGTAR